MATVGTILEASLPVMTIGMRRWRLKGHSSTKRAVLVLRFVNVTAFAELHCDQLSKLSLNADIFRVVNWDCAASAFRMVETLSATTGFIIGERLLVLERCSQSCQQSVPGILRLNFRPFWIGIYRGIRIGRS